MAEITPFQGLRYNQNIAGNIEDVICPPYDVISDEDQKLYYDKSEYNVIRLEHGRVMPGDNEKNNKYIRARDTLTNWMKDGVLKIDNDHTFYIYEQGFTHNGGYRKRVGLVACVRLEPFSRKVIFPHENTSSGVKLDRLELMRALNANVSPILCLYEDPGNKITKLMTDRMLAGRLLININNGDDTHRVWKANEPEFVQRVSHFMSPKSIYIADGHHRYETSLAYRDERAKNSLSQGTEGYNYIMMTLVSFSDPGIIMLPVHRLFKKIPNKSLPEIQKGLAEYFEMTPMPINELSLEDKKGTDIRVIGLEPDKIINLRMLSSVLPRDAMPAQHSPVYQRLDVSIMEHIITEKVLSTANKEGNIVFTPDAQYALNQVNQGACQLAFLLNMMPPTTVKSIADSNDRMPRKSTYFFPKLPTGLVISRLDGKL
ncbi:MAG: hypothetical protein A2Z02_02870 [Chloroflexi bacterium RBG_16_48_7]|nr:MAG: hypothetical protein A2Z02_02870 [Chloroflexi bacterium RBG_16_48_7]